MIDIIDVILTNKNNEIYIQQRSPNSKSYPSTWELPGGKIEKTESHKDCIIREIKEELNLEIKNIVNLVLESPMSLISDGVWTYYKYFVYFAEVENWDNFRLEEGKATDYKFLNKDEIEILNIERHDKKTSPLYLAVKKFFYE